jgi:DNA-binding transcriptional LysR family regulator
MEFKQLTYFCELMKVKNIARASEHLFLTHQALSLSISKLEEELGVPLFLRSQRGLEPTLYASILYRHARAIQQELEKTKAEISQAASKNSGQVKLDFSYAVIGEEGSLILHDALNQHVKNQYELILHEDYSTHCMQSLEAGRCDLAIALGSYDSKKLTGIRLGRMETWVMVSRKNRLASRKSLSLKDLKNETLLFPMVQDTFYTAILKGCARYGFEPKVQYLNLGTPTILKKVENNAGVWLIMQTIEKLYGSDQVVTLPLDRETAIILDLYLLYRKGAPLTPQAVDLYQYLSRCAR